MYIHFYSNVATLNGKSPENGSLSGKFIKFGNHYKIKLGDGVPHKTRPEDHTQFYKLD